MASKKILFVLTSADKDLKDSPAGWYLPELAHPYAAFQAAGWSIDFAAPKGPNPPVDLRSVETFKDDQPFLEDKTVQAKLETTKKLIDVNSDDYDIIFYVGGHGPVIDLPTDAANIKLASEFYRKGKVTSAVCHGTAALANVTTEDGESIFKGKKFTGFSNFEENAIGKIGSIPFLLEDKIGAQGGIYEKASEPWAAHVTVDGTLYTGQNPASAAPLAEAILKHFQ